jgi:hypothetical protein
MIRRNCLLSGCTLVLAALLACKGKEDTRCAATVTLDGKPGQGTGEGPDNASASACLDWCAQHDALIDESHKSWKQTPAGQQSTGTRFSEIYSAPEGPSLMTACKTRCLSLAKRGENLRVNCP